MGSRTQTLIVGRGRDSGILLTHNSVSRRHAELTIAPDGSLAIRDLQSTGGTFILRNGKEIPVEEATLKLSDTLRLGEYDIPVKELLLLVPEEKPDARSKRVAQAPASPAPAPAAPGKSRMMRCSCGTIKERGKPCPDCGS